MRARRPNQLKHGLSYTPEYRAWQTMRHRCTNPASPAWDDYGGRGITMHEGWIDDPAAFVAHVGPRPSARHEIDRIDNERGYEPGNLRWATRSQNDRNRRNNSFVEFDGERLTVAEWCERLGIRGDTLRWRLNSGWSVEDALRTQAAPRKPFKNRRTP